jgi:ADP-ribosylation factor protein 1/Arf/Sar family protein
VIDSSYSISEAKEELHSLIINDQVTKTQPLLIMVCSNSTHQTNLSVMATDLGLDQVKDRKWSLRQIDASTMTGVWEGLYWLSLQVKA